MFDAKFKVSGKYKAVVRGPDMEIRRETGWFDNIVTNAGVQMLLGGASSTPGPASFSVSCCVGSGNSPPTAGDTQLASFVAGSRNGDVISSSSTRNSTVAPYYSRIEITWRFGMGAAAGNISEVGVANPGANTIASTTLFSRALIRDAGGNPTTITVLSDEYLDITYHLYIYAPVETTGSFNQVIDGVLTAFSYTMRPCNMNTGGTPDNSQGWAAANSGGTALPTVMAKALAGSNYTSVYPSPSTLGAVSGVPSGTAAIIPNASSSAGNYALKYRDLTYTAALGDANVTFDAYKMQFNIGCMQMKISPPIAKVGTKTYNFTIRVTLDNLI